MGEERERGEKGFGHFSFGNTNNKSSSLIPSPLLPSYLERERRERKKRMVGPSASIPSGSKKMVQSLKEIVNCSEAEIYMMLKECNMDPSEAVHRLLSQDTFHEVKSKREKKKETKDTPESRSRAVNNNSIRGSRGGTDRGGRIIPTQSSSNDYGVYGKAVHKKENGSNPVPTLFVGSSPAGNNPNQRTTILCESISMQNTTQEIDIADGPSLPSQPLSGFQHNWSRMPGQMSMADIVRMGKPQGKPTVARDTATFHASYDPLMSNLSQHDAKHSPVTIPPSESFQEFHASQGPHSQDEQISYEPGTAVGHQSSHDDWSLVDKTPAESGSNHPEISDVSIYDDLSASSTLLADEANLHLNPHLDDNQVLEGDDTGNSLPTETVRSTFISDRQIEDNSGDSTHSDDDPLNGMSSYHSQRHEFEHLEVEDDNEEISSAAANFQQLDLHKEELGSASAEENPAVIIPSHLQVTNADCSHLSFGSFSSGVNVTFSGSFASTPLKSYPEVVPAADDAPSLDQLSSRNHEYYDNDELNSTLNENVTSRTSASPISYDMPSATQPEIIRDDALDAAPGLQDNFPSVSGYTFSTTAQPTAAAYTYPEPNSQMQNLSPFSSLMQPYTNSLPSTLLTPPVQPFQEFDIPFSALLTTQSMPTKYSTSSISGTAISMPEAKQEVFSTPQPTPQSVPSNNIPTAGGPALPQHLHVHPYSQPTLPLGHFANMMGYPFLPQSYAFLPSAGFQQSYTGGSPFHQSPAAGMKYSPLLPQYKSGVSVSSLPQAPALPPGYGGFTSSTNNVPGGFSLNPSSSPASTTIGFDEALSSQYKEGSQYLPPPHNENSAMWLHGAGSRAVSALPASTFYGFQAQQNQHNGGFRQAQQQPSHYGSMGYLNYYHQSQGGPAQEQHQQNPSEGNMNMNGSQGPASHQIWQHGY